MDVAARKTDKRLEEIEKRLHKIYEQAQDDLTKSWKNYMEAQNAYVKDLQEAYGRAKDFGTPEEVREIGKELGVAKAERTLQNQYYKDMVKETTRKLANVNQTALNYVNGQMFWVYSTNYNQAAKDADKVGFRFDLVDEATVRRRVMDGDIQLPKKKINVPKDQRWNTKQLNSSVLQGIVNGESMQKIADRILPVVNNNATAAIRNARTMVTGAQNQGRQDSYGMMDKMGIVLKKIWMATHDERTRESHQKMDGEEVEYDKEFSNGLMFPGDPNGAPEEVYNCRCTMVTDIVGLRKADGRIETVDTEKYEPDYFNEQNEEQNEHIIAEGRDITLEWNRRRDDFDFEIEDVINAQGFDGKPRVVSPEEFERYVQEANGGNGFIAQRTYSAPNQEILDAYQEQLYNGKWYVDCSTGGAQYGQGMYCAADYNGKLSDGIREEMRHYQELNCYRGNPVYKTETVTLDPSAKIIKYKDIGKARDDHDELIARSIIEKELEKQPWSEMEKRYFKARHFGIDDNEEILQWWKSRDSFERDMIQEVMRPYVGDLRRKISEKQWEFRELDEGAQCALMGYDAINAEGHGKSGSYTVVLNRTKLIIRRSKK